MSIRSSTIPFQRYPDYKIRFQNTGTDTAFVVIIRDTIDAGLDLTTPRTGGLQSTRWS